jgi:hypothetical protein
LWTEHWMGNCFCFDFCRFSRWYNTGVISGSQIGFQLLQNTEIIKQTDVLLWKIWRKYESVSYLFSCNAVRTAVWRSLLFCQNLGVILRKTSLLFFGLKKAFLWLLYTCSAIFSFYVFCNPHLATKPCIKVNSLWEFWEKCCWFWNHSIYSLT